MITHKLNTYYSKMALGMVYIVNENEYKRKLKKEIIQNFGRGQEGLTVLPPPPPQMITIIFSDRIIYEFTYMVC